MTADRDAPLVGAEHLAAALERLYDYHCVQEDVDTPDALKSLCASADLQMVALSEVDRRRDDDEAGPFKVGVIVGLIARDLAATATAQEPGDGAESHITPQGDT